MNKIKVLILVLLIFTTSGCLLGSVGKGYLTKVCTLDYETNDIFRQEQITIVHKDNQVVTIENKYTYRFKDNKYVFQSFKDSNASQIINLSKEVGIEIEKLVDNDKEYIIIYKFDMGKIADNIKEIYQFQNEYHLQLRYLEDKGYICK